MSWKPKRKTSFCWLLFVSASGLAHELWCKSSHSKHVKLLKWVTYVHYRKHGSMSCFLGARVSFKRCSLCARSERLLSKVVLSEVLPDCSGWERFDRSNARVEASASPSHALHEEHGQALYAAEQPGQGG